MRIPPVKTTRFVLIWRIGSEIASIHFLKVGAAELGRAEVPQDDWATS